MCSGIYMVTNKFCSTFSLSIIMSVIREWIFLTMLQLKMSPLQRMTLNGWFLIGLVAPDHAQEASKKLIQTVFHETTLNSQS